MMEGGFIPPPAGAVRGGHPDLHAAFPGVREQQPQASGWTQPPGTPWAGWGNTPASGAAGASWANTPAHPPQGTPHGWPQPPSGWGTPAAGWPPMPRQGWGNAPPQHPHSAPATPWDHWGGPPPASAPAGHANGFSAMAAPPQHESMTGQPLTGGWFGQHGGAHHGPGHAAHGGWGQPRQMVWDPRDEEEEEEDGWQTVDPRSAGWDAAWAAATGGGGQGGHTPGAAAADPWGAGGHADPWGGHADPWAEWGQPEGHEMRRTHSQGKGKKAKAAARARSHSFGGAEHLPWGEPAPASAPPAPHPAWGGEPVYNEKHLAKRPGEWRDGYSPRGGVASDMSFSLFRKKTGTASEWIDPKKRTLAAPLVYNPNRPAIAYDLRFAPQDTPSMGAFTPRAENEMLQPAVMPPAQGMRLVHPRLPWYIDVRRGPHTPGVCLYDVLHTLFVELDKTIAARDFFNVELGKQDRAALTRTFKDRCGRYGPEFLEPEIQRGVKRVDFLGGEFVFVGLVKRNGVWEIKTVNNFAH